MASGSSHAIAFAPAGASAVTVAAGATLGGNGQLGGPLTVQTGGTLQPTARIQVLAGGTARFAVRAGRWFYVDGDLFD
mgnify:CR=1 FL=1